MTERLYAVILDQLDPNFNPLALRDALKAFEAVSHWWNHVPSCFLVTSQLDADQLTSWLRKHTGDVGFLVIETNPSNSQGYMPQRSWDWIQTRERELAREPVL